MQHHAPVVSGHLHLSYEVYMRAIKAIEENYPSTIFNFEFGYRHIHYRQLKVITYAYVISQAIHYIQKSIELILSI